MATARLSSSNIWSWSPMERLYTLYDDLVWQRMVPKIISLWPKIVLQLPNAVLNRYVDRYFSADATPYSHFTHLLQTQHAVSIYVLSRHARLLKPLQDDPIPDQWKTDTVTIMLTGNTTRAKKLWHEEMKKNPSLLYEAVRLCPPVAPQLSTPMLHMLEEHLTQGTEEEMAWLDSLEGDSLRLERWMYQTLPVERMVEIGEQHEPFICKQLDKLVNLEQKAKHTGTPIHLALLYLMIRERPWLLLVLTAEDLERYVQSVIADKAVNARSATQFTYQMCRFPWLLPDLVQKLSSETRQDFLRAFPELAPPPASSQPVA